MEGGGLIARARDFSKRRSGRTATLARRATVAATLALTMVTTAVPAHADEYCQPRGEPLASVLVVHGGGFTRGSTHWVRDLCFALRDMGYRARSLSYPLGSVSGAISYARAAAEAEAARGRPVYATGASAGGTIAAFLAVRPLIDGAVVVAPLTDFVNWRPPSLETRDALGSPAMRHSLSPINNVGWPAPLRILHAPDDTIVPYEQSVRLVARCGGRCELVPLRLGLGHFSVGARRLVLQWFAERARHPAFARTPAPAAPMISRAQVRPRVFAAGTRTATFRYALSAPARVTVVIKPDRGGCGRPGGDPFARCASRRVAAAFTVDGAAGENRVRLAGRIARRGLRPGRYRATFSVAATPGPRAVRFRVTR